jgi:hypothetical protein
MTEFTSEEINQLRAVVGVIKEHPDCAKELQKLLSKPEVAYKPWNPDGKEYYWVGMCGDVMHETGNASQHRVDNFNAFASEEAAKRAAADAKIRNLFWQWKEQNDKGTTLRDSNAVFFDCGLMKWSVSFNNRFSDFLSPFSSDEAAHQFIADCKPYLNEYARAMGWMTDGD